MEILIKNLLKLSFNMKKSTFILLFSLSILGASCNRQDKDVRSYTDAEVLQLKENIEKDQLWKDFVSIMHENIKIVTDKKMYVNETLYKNPPSLESKLAKVKSKEEGRQVLLNSGVTEVYADVLIRMSDCTSNLCKKFPEMRQIDLQRLNLPVPPPDGYPFNAITDPNDFLAKRTTKQ